MSPGKLQGCGRGVFGLVNWDIIRKPGVSASPSDVNSSSQSRVPRVEPRAAPLPQPLVGRPAAIPAKPTATPATVAAGAPTEGRAIHSKFSYQPNTSSPLGRELSLAIGERLVFIRAENEHWWLTENADGVRGFVPSAYMAVMEAKGSLPWLQNREEDLPSEEPVVRKPAPSYSCEICNKKFNGPSPYKAHMVSRAHREEEALLNER